MVVKRVKFNERVTVASLPVEEYKDAFHARRGLWGAAPNSDELWDGDRRVFWERELTTEELKEIMRFRRLARYASMLQGVGFFGIKVPMPKVPPIIEELVKEARAQQRSSNSSPRSESQALSEHYGIDPIALPREEHDGSPKLGDGSPKHGEKRKSHNLSATSVDEMYLRRSGTEQFEYTNPNLTPQSSAPQEGHSAEEKSRLSLSQKAAMQNVGKVLRLDSPRLGHAIHKTRSRKSRARKRIAAHAILQPWFVLLYFFVPLTLMASVYFVPFWRGVYVAWKDQKAIRAAIEVPYFFERLLRIPDLPLLQSTVFIGLFAVEVTTIVYLLMLVLSQLTMFIIVRPLVMSLAQSFAERGAAVD